MAVNDTKKIPINIQGNFTLSGDAIEKLEKADGLLKNVMSTMKLMSKGNDLSKYWKSEARSMDAVISAYQKFNSEASENNAGEFVKTANAFVAAGGNIQEVFDKIGSSARDMFSQAKTISGSVDSIFSVENFQNAFKGFSGLESIGINPDDVFDKLLQNSSAKVDELNKEVERLQRIADRREEIIEELQDTSKVGTLQNKLDNTSMYLEDYRDKSKAELRSLLESFNFDTNDYNFEPYFDAIEKGSMTANEAMKNIKKNMSELFASSPENPFSTTELQGLISGMKQVLEYTERISNAFRNGDIGKILADSMSRNPVLSGEEQTAMKGIVMNNNGADSIAKIVQTLLDASGDAEKSASDIVSAITNIISEFSKLDSIGVDKLNAITNAFNQLSKLNKISIGKAAISNLVDGLTNIGGLSVDEVASISRLAQINFDNFGKLKVSKSAVNNIISLTSGMSKEGIENLDKLKDFDFSKLENLKIEKANTAGLKNLKIDTKTLENLDKLKDVMKGFNLERLKSLADIDFSNLSNLRINSDVTKGFKELSKAITTQELTPAIQELKDQLKELYDVYSAAGKIKPKVPTADALNKQRVADDSVANKLSAQKDIKFENLSKYLGSVYNADNDEYKRISQSFTELSTRYNKAKAEYSKTGDLQAFKAELNNIEAEYIKLNNSAQQYGKTVKENTDKQKKATEETKKPQTKPSTDNISVSTDEENIDAAYKKIQKQIKDSRSKLVSMGNIFGTEDTRGNDYTTAKKYLDIAEQRLIDARSKSNTAEYFEKTINGVNGVLEMYKSATEQIDKYAKAKKEAEDASSSETQNKKIAEMGKVETNYQKSMSKINEYQNRLEKLRGTLGEEEFNRLNSAFSDVRGNISGIRTNYMESGDKSQYDADIAVANSKLEEYVGLLKEAEAVSKESASSATEANNKIIETQQELISAVKEYVNLQKLIASGDISEGTKSRAKALNEYIKGFDIDSLSNKSTANAEGSSSSKNRIEKNADVITGLNYNKTAVELYAKLKGKSGFSDEGNIYTDAVVNQYNELLATAKELSQMDLRMTNPEDVERFEKLNAEAKQFENTIRQPFAKSGKNEVGGLLNSVEQYKQIWSGLSKGAVSEIDAFTERVKGTIDISKADISSFYSEWNKMKSVFAESGEQRYSFAAELGNRIKQQSLNVIAMYFSLMDVVRYTQELVQNVTAIDSSLTELRKVSGASGEELANSFQVSADSAKELGATITDVIDSTTDWSRMGYSLTDSETLARTTTLFQNVGDDMTRKLASNTLVSVMKGYGMQAEQSMSIVDKLNEVANNFAVDTNGLSQALTRGGASLSAAGNTLDESLGLIVAANDSVQNPETVGQMLKTEFCLCL